MSKRIYVGKKDPGKALNVNEAKPQRKKDGGKALNVNEAKTQRKKDGGKAKRSPKNKKMDQ